MDTPPLASTNTSLSSPKTIPSKFKVKQHNKTICCAPSCGGEEFQEADILWPDDTADLKEESPRLYFSQIGIDDDDRSSEHQAPLKLQVVRQKASSPIDVPGRKVVGATAARGTDEAPAGWSKFSASHAGGAVGAGSAVVVGSHVFMPPHVIVDRRRAKRDKAMMMFIVPSGRARERTKMREWCYEI